MKTTENNKLIAVFMGKKINSITVEEFRKLNKADRVMFHNGFAEDLEYHTSWNELMPVVEKIEGDREDGELYEVRMNLTETKILDIEFNELVNIDGGDRQENTYQAIVEFIKWNNENK